MKKNNPATIARFDCFAGASGDMILGALFDAGLEPERLRSELDFPGLDHWDIKAEPVIKRGMGGTRAHVIVDQDHHGHHHRHLSHIREIIENSPLSPEVREKSLHIFTRLAGAEARVHRTTPEAVHFHEVGAVDAIIDIVGAVAGLALMGVDKIFCSPLHTGSGTIRCAHGILPVPAPATAELVRGVPVYSTGVDGELLTPTGAAILTTLAENFGSMPPMVPERIGYGVGNADPEIPNLLRVCIGKADTGQDGYDADQVAVLEAAVDDMNPQIYEIVMRRALDAGALDIFLTPVQMKKQRPGTLITLLCRPGDRAEFSDLLLRETTSIGLRWRLENRTITRRTMEIRETPLGPVCFKIARRGDEIINISPEYEDCRRIATEQNIPLKKVMEMVLSAI